MGSEGTNAALSSLQSKDYAQFLDVIDLLRSQGISHYVQLPQLIVCGDQSSGKSSVLEAVSGVRFPTKDNLCTRFATELILRRSSTTSATIAILPGSEKSDEEKKRLLEFKAPTVQLDDFPSLIDAAKDAMGLNSDAKAFSDDVLRVEISGPRQPHLTLVDLPGLIHAENKQQSAKDVRLVQSLVRSYMANTRSIILAVVSAKNDYANQIVTKLARDVDPGGLRTLGIITKPDMLHVGSESETAFLNLARNEDVVFRLGWHVLRNRDFDSRECSVEERDERERNFFSQGVWTSLTASTVGIMALKPRLSTVLINHVVSELPSLVRDIKAGIDDCRRRLSRLGEARQTPQEQRRYLVHVSRSFSSIVKAAVDGVYVHEFFGDAMTDEGFSKRLRAVVQDLLLEFAKTIHREGHDREIVENAAVPETVSGRKRILRSAFEDHVRELIRRSRGRELPGTLNPLVVGDLFFQQAGPWKGIVDCFSERILQATRESLELVLLYTTDESTREGLRREVIGPAMEWHAEQLKSKVEEILRPHRKGHAITYNHYFTENVQKAREDYAKRVQARRVNTFGTSDADAAMDRCTCSEAVDCMQAYYKVALKMFIDNFAVLGIEHCILNKLADTFSPDTVMGLDDALTTKIAAETTDSSIERARATTKLKILEDGLRTLNRLDPHKQLRTQLVVDSLDRRPGGGIPPAEEESSDGLLLNGEGVLREGSGPVKEAAATEEARSPVNESSSPRQSDSWINGARERWPSVRNNNPHVRQYY